MINFCQPARHILGPAITHKTRVCVCVCPHYLTAKMLIVYFKARHATRPTRLRGFRLRLPRGASSLVNRQVRQQIENVSWRAYQQHRLSNFSVPFPCPLARSFIFGVRAKAGGECVSGCGGGGGCRHVAQFALFSLRRRSSDSSITQQEGNGATTTHRYAPAQ